MWPTIRTLLIVALCLYGLYVEICHIRYLRARLNPRPPKRRVLRLVMTTKGKSK